MEIPVHSSAEGIQGQTVIITGAAHGIGLRVSQYLQARGVAVIAVDRDADKLAAAELGDAVRIAWDVAEDQEGLIRKIRESSPQPRLLFNNVSLTDGRSFLDLPEDGLRRSMDVNLFGPWLLTRAFVKGLLEQKVSGSVVFNLSLHTTRVRMFPDYSVGKAGLLMLVKELSSELGHVGVRVNAISPGAIDTWSDIVPEPAEHRRNSEAQIPLGRIGGPDDVAPAVAFLLDDSVSGYITGTDLRIDGGLDQYNWLHKMYGSAAAEAHRTRRHD